MATLAELRSRLRVHLGDNAAEGYLWSDGALDLYLNDAIRDYGRSFPRQRETTIATVAEQREYDLPADCLMVVQVVLVGAYGHTPLLEGRDAGGTGYEAYAGKLALSPTPSVSGETVAVRYLAPHAALALDEDISTVPAADDDLLLAFACARALQTLSAEDAKRQMFEARSGRPAEAVASIYWEQYERGIGLRAARVRTGRLSIAT